MTATSRRRQAPSRISPAANTTFTRGPNPNGLTYDTGGIVNNTFYQECTTQVDTPSSLFTLVTMQATSPDAQNYANWYSYYRSRRLLMRTAVGKALHCSMPATVSASARSTTLP